MSTTSCKRCGAPLPGDEARTALQGMCTKCLLELGLEEDSQVVITGAAESPAPPPSPEELQPLFPQFEILELLGQGGMGVVYRARQKELGREVALKVLPARAGRNPAFAERFTREAKALASLQHPNITSVYDFGKAGEHFFLAMEFVDGLNLRALLRAQRVAPKQALQIVEQICDALQYAHDQGVVHRDIKPENILLDRKGRLKITDFGLAKLLAREPGAPPSIGLTLTHQVMGTPHYMAPEQIEHPAEVDHRADIYSLGVVFYELLTGELPLGRFAPPSGKVRVDVRLDEVVLRALEKERELRYQSAGAVRTDVRGIEEPGTGEKAEAYAGGAGARHVHARTPRRAWRWAIAAGLLLVLGSIGAAVAAMILADRRLRADETQRHLLGQDELLLAEARERAERNARLEGVPVFFGGYLSLPFRTVFEIDDEVKEACLGAVGDGMKIYEPLLAAHTLREIPEPGVGRITVEPFPEEARAVAEGVLREMRALLPPEAYGYLVTRQALEQELFPPATERVVHEIRRTPEGFAWSTSTGGRPAVLERGESLPEDLARYWREMFRPLGASVAAPLERFVEEVRALDAGTGKVLLGTVQIAWRGDSTELSANLIFKGDDVDESTRLLERLRGSLKALPEFSAATASTGSFGSSGISAPLGVQIRATAPELPLPLVAAEGGEQDLLPVLNQLASGQDIALRSVVPSTRTQTSTWRDVLYVLKQDEARPLDAQLAWIRSLEELGPDSVVTEAALSPNEGRERWVAKVDLLARLQR